MPGPLSLMINCSVLAAGFRRTTTCTEPRLVNFSALPIRFGDAQTVLVEVALK